MRASPLVTLVPALALLGCSTTEPSTSTPVTSRATGDLGPWQAAAAMPTPRANHCVATLGDRVVVIGGNHAADGGFVKTAQIHAASLVDGQLGPWQLLGEMPSPLTECAAASDGARIYVVDGIFDRDTDAGQVWSMAVAADGTLESPASLGSLPAGARAISSEATLSAGELLVMDTLLPTEGDTTLTLRMNTDTRAWSPSLDWQIGFRAQTQHAFTERFLYTLGGYQDTTEGTTTDVFVAPVDGSGPVRATTSLPVGVGFGEAIAVDDWLFVVGGRGQVFGAPGTTDVFAAPIADDGSLGEWRTLPPLPMARTNHELALVGDHLVLTGGAAMGPGDATVLVAQVRWSQSQ